MKKEEKEEEQMLLNRHPTEKTPAACLLYSMAHAKRILNKKIKKIKIPVEEIGEMEWW